MPSDPVRSFARLAAVLLCLTASRPAPAAFVNFESGHVRPLAIAPAGDRLFAVNTPDNRLAVYTITAGGLTLAAEVPVGLEPVAVAARTNLAGRTEAWVVNHLSDSVSVVEIDPADVTRSRVVRTLLVGDEPRDIVFAGSNHDRAFITAARRGQNRFASDPAGGPQLTSEGTGRGDVWVFDANSLGAPLGGTPLATVQLFGDTPRALTASLDGSIVYAAIFHSGNQTTAITEEVVTSNGGLPPPPPGSTGGAPNTGLIVKFDGSRWRDEIGRDWSASVAFALPDEDVFMVNADSPLSPPGFVTGIGTVLFNMAVRPTNGKVYVANTDAQNQVRFEPFVRGHLAESRITVINGITAVSHHLNPHIDYGVVPGPQSEIDRSLAFPTDMAFSSDGHTLFVAGFGSGKIGIFNADDLEAGVITETQLAVGNGPSGVVLDAVRDRVYVMNRIDHTISIVGNASNPATRAVSATVPLRYDPSPPAARNGRIFLYDARRSGHGDSACASCHIFGDFDSLAWDLGDPFGTVVNNPNPFRVPKPSGSPVFHPMKGPMTTQSLRGMADPAGPMHWRGDRTGGGDAGGNALAEDQAFKKFNPAFVGLLGAASQLTTAEMQSYTDFILTVRYPPNPIRALDNGLTSAQSTGQSIFLNSPIDGGQLQCAFCHKVPLGTDGFSSFEGEPQEFKIAHLRNLYQKVGMFGVPPGTQAPATGFLGDQVRGFGFLHDGSIDTVFDFLNANVFNFGSNPDTKRRQVEAFLMAFDTGLAPIVGQQVTATSTTFGDSTVTGRINTLMIPRANAGECDLVVKGVRSGEARGWLYQPGSGQFQSDRASEPLIGEASLRAQAAVVGQELTYTAVPPGTGSRIAIDRDEDGFFDRTELDAGTDPANPASNPGVSTTTTTTTTTTTSTTTTVSPPPPTTTTTTTTIPPPSTTTTSTTTVPPPSTTTTSTTVSPSSTTTITTSTTSTTAPPASTTTTTSPSTTTTTTSTTLPPSTTTSVATTTTSTTLSPTTTTSTTTSTTSTSTTTSTTTTTRPPSVLIQTTSLKLRDRSTPVADANARRVAFRSTTKTDPPANRIVPPLPGSNGDPTAAGGSLTVYNSAGTGEAVTVSLAGSGWSRIGTGSSFVGWRFSGHDPDGPISSVTVKSDRITLRGGHSRWTYRLDQPPQGSVAVRLTVGTTTWCANAPARTSGNPPSTAANDAVDRFNAQPRTPPPASCPP